MSVCLKLGHYQIRTFFYKMSISTYTPQQNGVAERKNRMIMNMVRSMLT